MIWNYKVLIREGDEFKEPMELHLQNKESLFIVYAYISLSSLLDNNKSSYFLILFYQRYIIKHCSNCCDWAHSHRLRQFKLEY